MKTALKALIHSILVIGSVVALSNCGNSKNEDDSQTGTTVPRKKNAALSVTTLPKIAPKPAVILTTTSVARTVTTPLPSVTTTKP